jgi:NitT/TauT family transport system ATP-binding protein
VFQEYALFPWRTALANVEFGPLMRHKTSEPRRALARRYLELVGLQAHESKYPNELSGVVGVVGTLVVRRTAEIGG